MKGGGMATLHGPEATSTEVVVGSRAAKDELHEAFARVGKALANPHRVEVLDLLAQGERSVEVLAARADISVALASAHLQILRRAGLVASRRDGNRILYRLANDDAYGLLTALRTVAARLGDAEQAARRYLGTPVEAVSREELLARVRAGVAIVVDLRPAEEYEAGHIAGALSIPLPDLEARLAELSADVEIVAYCRGPYCAMSPQGVALLERLGRRARRLEDGFPEWRLAGLPVATGREDA
jgi:rhodanese-related sulfurtransferase/DNA-binding MarR family transcriptional regulator